MKDSLKNYIDENRDGFEIFNDDFDTSWQEIDKRLSKQKRKAQFNIIWKVAAAVALWALVGVGALKFYYAFSPHPSLYLNLLDTVPVDQ